MPHPIHSPNARRIAQGLATIEDAQQVQRQQERLARLEVALRWVAIFADPKTRRFAQRVIQDCPPAPAIAKDCHAHPRHA